MKEIYQQTKKELLERYGGDTGCTEADAKKLLEKYGKNVLVETGKKSAWKVFMEQFADLLVAILMVAAILSMVSGNMESTIVILAVLVLNALLGTMQYIKAEKTLDSLKELSAQRAKVLREGEKREISARELVPGDILLLEAGDMVGADGRILENHSLQVNESALTGESANVEKNDKEIAQKVALAERYNMVFSGSLVTCGRANVLVTATGMSTEMGKIAALMNETKDKKTPLQISLYEFGKKLSMAILLVSMVVFGLRIWQKEPVLDSLMFAVALAVAAIPEALGAIVTIVQALGTKKMAADHAIIKDLKVVESLGCVSVICSDKTGTLTQNRMQVKEVYIDDKCIVPEQLNLSLRIHRYLLYTAILNNDSTIHNGKDIGDPTETCLLTMARKAGLTKAGITEEDIRSMMPRMEEIPFDSERKLMSTKYRVHGVPTVFTKGAVDVLIDRIENIELSEGIRPITQEDKLKIIEQNRIFSENGLRVLAFVYKECDKEDILSSKSEYGYTFVGLVSMIDPPREEALQAVKNAIDAGIKPVMITGDHKVTATAIAKQLKIFKEGDRTVTGQELDEMTDAELEEELKRISVYARVSPENKIRIVKAWQKMGNIVVMTGDGVNDAPALKKADIGVAMGITGTEVSKDAAAMVLADDNFATIMKAVLNGRNVYRNIMNAIQFLLSGNMAAILVVLYCSFMALSTPFEPVHLLFINLLTDSLPALAIGVEPSDEKLLKIKPRNPKTGMLTKSFCLRIIGYGVFIAIVTLFAFYLGLEEGAAKASTMAFATLTLARLFHGFTCRSDASIFKIKLKSNKWSLKAFGLGCVLLFSVLLVPFMQGPFKIEQLTFSQIGWVMAFSFLPTACIQIVRVVKEGRDNEEIHKGAK